MSEIAKKKKEEQTDTLFKFILVGNASSGKTCLLHYYLEGKPKQNSSYTIGVEFGSKVETIGSKLVRIQLWDTAGQDRFKSVARTYYRGAVGALVVFDLTNLESFHSVQNWINDVRELANKEVCIIVCGNKSDIADERVVQAEDATRLCQSVGVSYIETSALTGDRVEEAFGIISRQIMEKLESHQIDPVLQPRPFLGRKIDSFDEEKKNKMCQC